MPSCGPDLPSRTFQLVHRTNKQTRSWSLQRKGEGEECGRSCLYRDRGEVSWHPAPSCQGEYLGLAGLDSPPEVHLCLLTTVPGGEAVRLCTARSKGSLHIPP